MTSSANNSILKSGNKTTCLDSTKYTSFNGTTLINNTSTPFHRVSKLDQAYKNATSIIDELITALQHKK